MCIRDSLKGASAVIDKDYASCLLAKELDADMLIILTAVEKVAVNFGKENEEWLDDITVDDAKKYINEGQFAPEMCIRDRCRADHREIQQTGNN